MNRIPRWLAIPLAAMMLALSTLAPASAVTIKYRSVYVAPHITQYKCYHDYNWWETYVLGYQDGWRYTAQACR